MYFFDT
ncbi:putative membrane protein, partial [Yersinia pestis PY-103]